MIFIEAGQLRISPGTPRDKRNLAEIYWQHSLFSDDGDKELETKKRVVGAVMYPDFEMLDMFGPLEMFSVLGTDKVDIRMIAQGSDPVPTAMGEALEAGPRVMLEFLRQRSESAHFTCSVCTGSLLLAKAGILEGRRALFKGTIE